MTEKNKVLCVCFGNTCRSPIMEILFNSGFKSIGVSIKAESAGIVEQDGKPASEFTLEVLKNNGFDGSEHTSRCIKNLNLAEYSKIYCVDEKTKTALIEAKADESKIVILNDKNGGIPNPYEKPYEEYETCFAQIKKSVDEIIYICGKAI